MTKGRFWLAWLSVGVIVSVAAGASFVQEIHRRILVRQQIEELRREVEAREHQILQLRQLTEYFQTDAYLERVAREKLGYQRPGEQMVVVPREDRVMGDRDELVVPQEQETIPVPVQWWNLYFGNR